MYVIYYRSTDRSAFVRIMRRSMGSQALLNLCLGANVRTSTTSPTPITDPRQTDRKFNIYTMLSSHNLF